MARMGLCSWLVVACLVTGCGDDEDDGLSRAEARDEATLVTCDYVERCDGIGEGEDYATREECDIETRAFLDRRIDGTRHRLESFVERVATAA